MTELASGPLRIRRGDVWADLAPSLRALLDAPGPAGPSAPACSSSGKAPPTAVIVDTSGSTGTPKQVQLSGAALRASGEATATVLGGHGQWLLALPTHHVAGLQVLARSVLAHTDPVSMDPTAPFTAGDFATVASGMDPDVPRYASLVPTHLHRLLADPAGTRALVSLDAVLLGGAAADAELLRRARAAGVHIVTTYGMSETCGGCVYDGIPLPGVRVRIDEDDRIHLGGPMLADGYPGRPELSAERFVEAGDGRWFITDDRGVWRDSRLVVLGRVDDIIVTGGHKVDPSDVEARLRELPEVDEALVIGVQDAEWGQRVAALVVAPRTRLTTREVRARLSPTLPPHALPRQVELVEELPLLDSGKPDRARAQEFLVINGRMGLHPR